MAKYPPTPAGTRIDAALLQSMLPEYVVKATDTDRTNTTTMSADPDLTAPVEANAVYCVEFYIYYGGAYNADSAADGDFVTSWSTPSGTTGLKSVIGPGTNAAASSLAHTVNAVRLGVHQLATNVQYACVRNATNLLQLAYEQAIITTGATPGNVTLQWAQESSSATATRVSAGSFMRLTRMA